MYLIVGCSIAKEMWECLEETYLQATKDKEFQLKQQLQSVKLGTKTIDEYIKEFKGICVGLGSIHKHVDEDSKVINFARGLGLKYKTFRNVMLGRMKKTCHNKTIAWHYLPKGAGEEETTLKEEETITSILEEEASSLLDKEHVLIQQKWTRWDYSYQAADELPQVLPLAATNLQNTSDDTLYVDSGASSHMTHNSGILTDLKHYNGPDKIIIGNGSKLDITHVGNISESSLKLTKVLVVPKINKNLLSVSKLAKDNYCTLEFDETNFVVKDKKTRTLLAKGSKRNRLYSLEDNTLYALTAAHD
ncbi:hypothetical protein KY289_011208 [Solanum tuberosum]|nr:hypothetical protein KY289_011208 [Solanum tuberosum]